MIIAMVRNPDHMWFLPGIVLCFGVRHFSLTVHFSTYSQVAGKLIYSSEKLNCILSSVA